MKKFLSIVMLMMPLVAVCQPRQTNPMSHPATITILDRKGEVTRNRNIIAYIKGSHPVVHHIDRNGELRIPSIPAGDTVALVIRNRIYEFKAADAHNMEIRLGRNDRISSVTDNGVRLSSGSYRVVPAATASPSVTVTDANDASQYSSLADYLMGRIAGLVVEGGPGNYQVYLDGFVPLVVVDGMRMNSFNAANALVLPSDIASVTVDRNGILYGAAGMNGVLIITTKS